MDAVSRVLELMAALEANIESKKGDERMPPGRPRRTVKERADFVMGATDHHVYVRRLRRPVSPLELVAECECGWQGCRLYATEVEALASADTHIRRARNKDRG